MRMAHLRRFIVKYFTSAALVAAFVLLAVLPALASAPVAGIQIDQSGTYNFEEDVFFVFLRKAYLHWFDGVNFQQADYVPEDGNYQWLHSGVERRFYAYGNGTGVLQEKSGELWETVATGDYILVP